MSSGIERFRVLQLNEQPIVMDQKEETNEETTSTRFMWWQWLAGVGVTLMMLQVGLMGGWSSPYIAKLTSPDSPLPVTITEASWLVTLFSLGQLIGAIGGCICIAYLGSKTTILIMGTPLACHWIFTLIGRNVIDLYIGRFCGGIAIGMEYGTFPIYLAEVADPRIRGCLMTLGACGASIGYSLICILGGYLSMETTAIISLIPCAILGALFIWLPESPHHLIRHKKLEAAMKSLAWYRRDCKDLQEEFISLTNFVTTNCDLSFFKKLGEFKQPQTLRASIITCFLLMYSQMSGVNTILAFIEIILRNGKITVIDPAKAVMINSLFGIIGSSVCLFIIDRLGRRFLMCLSCIIGAAALTCLGMHFQLIELGFDPAYFQWLPLTSLIFFTIALFGGIRQVPSTVLGEIFPPSVKYMATCFSSITAGLFATVSASTYQPLLDIFGQQYVIWMYAVFLLTAIPFTLVFLPETKGKSLQQIQDDLKKA